ncbi:MAG: gluconate 2-dehydrogenase subunit 3 family protein [Bryobacterales bacterium]|nr:gluconate 2-dehydrogenase subunit 3 family protein [Bryobacterales bacterium]
MADRRETLKILGAIGSTCAFPFATNELYAQHVHDGPGTQAPAGPPRFFGEAQMKLIGCIADRIIPPTDSPGAVDAGVPGYIDFVVSRNETLQGIFTQGLAWMDEEAQRLHGQTFEALDASRQIGILRPLSDAVDAGEESGTAERFFRAIKSLCADGYYTSQAGLITELGYTGNVALAAFPECEIPEH